MSAGTDDQQMTRLDGLDGLGDSAWAALHRISRAVHVPGGELEPTLQAVLGQATSLIDRTDAAGVNLVVKGRFVPQASVGAAPPELDRLQALTGTGPCIDASEQQAVIRVDDMRAEERWPQYRDLALELGVTVMMCVPLWIDDARVGSLSLYSHRGSPYSEHHRQLASLFATHAAVAIADARLVENLRAALASRDVIGQAKGVLMERERITADEAFDRLRAASQLTGRKLSAVAEDVALYGALPDGTQRRG